MEFRHAVNIYGKIWVRSLCIRNFNLKEWLQGHQMTGWKWEFSANVLSCNMCNIAKRISSVLGRRHAVAVARYHAAITCPTSAFEPSLHRATATACRRPKTEKIRLAMLHILHDNTLAPNAHFRPVIRCPCNCSSTLIFRLQRNLTLIFP